MVEHYEKVRCDVGRPQRRPGIELCVPDACLTRIDHIISGNYQNQICWALSKLQENIPFFRY